MMEYGREHTLTTPTLFSIAVTASKVPDPPCSEYAGEATMPGHLQQALLQVALVSVR